MKIFKRRETLLENMAFMGVISAVIIIVNAFVSLGDMFFPIIGIVLSLILPILVTLVEVSCKDRYYPIFFAVTILLSFIVTLWNFESTIYYLLPSLISGYIFGLFIKRRFPIIYGIFIASVIQGLLIFISFKFIYLITSLDMIEVFLKLLQLSESSGARLMVYPTLFGFGLIEMSLVALIISFELERFSLSFNDSSFNEIYVDIILILISVISMMLYFFLLDLAYLFMTLSLYFVVMMFTNAIREKKWIKLIIYGVILIVNFVIFVILYRYMITNGGFILFLVSPILISLTSLCFILLNKNNK